ncbi:MAG: bifunctional demethylmenaquinone methyltransferase/2-methoxy-6-polyprenyl-1,4-benzoquinol methylase UbiE, partial [Gemmataceae bacterium]|nr:bifunctional demethylmenaquinone methyltransferase/2-methoxy-6-polyprenyl-1,4-benzoquinol methylase UbiE [Gemmataceae bacterium]
MNRSDALLDKREQRIRQMFGEIAPWYDFLNHLLSLNIDRYWRRKTVQLIPPPVPAAGPILDVCTGSGDLAIAYARAADPTLPIIGADFCHELLLQAQRKAQRLVPTHKLTFVEADAQYLPFPDNTFALVCVAFGLRNITDMHRGLSEMVRVCQPGGRLAILEFSQPRHRFLGRLYLGYFLYFLPLIGQLLARNRQAAYRYLPESVLRFPDYERLADTLRNHGLEQVTFTPFTGGIATLYQGRKPSGASNPSIRENIYQLS